MSLRASELKSLRGFLRNAKETMTDAGDLVQSSDTAQAARIKTIAHRIADEINETDRKLADAERAEESGK